MNHQFPKNVAEQWKAVLKNEGYEHRLKNRNECVRLRRFSRVWRKIFNYIPEEIRMAEDKSIFEFGCGGGKHLAQFMLNNWMSTGIDCSSEVLERAKNYLNEVKRICGCRKNFDLVLGDFLDYESKNQYDIVFNAGVIEHFLDDSERKKALGKMFDIAKEGGYVISIVPSGMHPLRQKVKAMGLGGYNIPEIDYAPALIEKEMRCCGGEEIKILPHNIMGYRLIDNRKGILRLIDLFLYYLFQIIPLNLFPKAFLYRHAMTLIGIARKQQAFREL